MLLGNHGALVLGAGREQAARLLATLDEAAQLVVDARRSGGEKLLPEAAFAEVQARIQKFQG